MPNTGETCAQSGDYVARCDRGHFHVTQFMEGTPFPACLQCASVEPPEERVIVLEWTLLRTSAAPAKRLL
jgi:hypothetical protein